MSERCLQTSAVSSAEASSTTTISTSVPAARALSTARGSKCGRLCVVMMMLALIIDVAPIRSGFPGLTAEKEDVIDPISSPYLSHRLRHILDLLASQLRIHR